MYRINLFDFIFPNVQCSKYPIVFGFVSLQNYLDSSIVFVQIQVASLRPKTTQYPSGSAKDSFESFDTH